MKLQLGDYFSVYVKDFQRNVDILLKGPTPLIQVLTGSGIPVGEIHMVVVNGEIVALDSALVSQEDVVKIFPAIDGG